jgi:hypothetical protein
MATQHLQVETSPGVIFKLTPIKTTSSGYETSAWVWKQRINVVDRDGNHLRYKWNEARPWELQGTTLWKSHQIKKLRHYCGNKEFKVLCGEVPES